MAWEHLSITKPHLVYIILGGFTSLFMLCSSVIKERLYIGEATVATICGIIFGPHAANLINPLDWGNTDLITLEFSRIVLVVQCFAVGVELPKAYMERHWRSVTFLLIPVMTWGWLVTSLFIWWMFHSQLNWLDSLCVAACVTATDPVLASSVVGKGKFAKRVPKHLRDLLSAESGCNDGMAFPFIYLAIYLIRYRPDANKVSFHWFCYTILYECIFGAVYGVLIGYAARRMIRYAHEHDLIDRESFLVFYFVLALFCAGSGSLLGVDDLLVGFACGVGFSNDGWFTEKTEESHVSNVIDLLINLTFFVYFGTIIPWEQYNSDIIGTTPWRLVVVALLVIFFRRIPIMLMLKPLIPDIKTWREALFAGHFGPIGVGGLFVAILARAEFETESTTPLSELPEAGYEHLNIIELIWPITTFLVISSILVHGSSVAVFTLGKHINTLTLTLSYTQANDEGPSWMDRLPRIQSRSKSSMSMRRPGLDDTDSSLDEKGEVPPGELPPIGLRGNFLRRQREDEAGSRSSSARPRSRKRWDASVGPGGPISQSAIAPQHRNRDHADVPSGHHDSDTIAADESPESSLGKEKTPSGPQSPQEEIYEEGRKTVFEDEEGNVLGIRESRKDETEEERQMADRAEGNKLLVEKDVEGGVSRKEDPPGDEGEKVARHIKEDADKAKRDWKGTWKKVEKVSGLKRKDEDETARAAAGKDRVKEKEKEKPKRGAALAYQFGNTIIVEDEDGEVIKKYDIPGPKRPGAEDGKTRQRLQRMGTWLGVEHGDSNESEAGPSKKANRKKRQQEDEEDDKKIRFTVTADGRRMSKAEFIQQIQKMDPKARARLVERSNVPEPVKEEARADAAEHALRQQQGSPAAEQSPIGAARDDPRSEAVVERVGSNEDRPAGPQGLTLVDSEDEDIPFHSVAGDLAHYHLGHEGNSETAAQRRRRQFASQTEDDEDADTASSHRGRVRSTSPNAGSGHSSPERAPAAPVKKSHMDEGETAAERRRREGALGMHDGDSESSSDEEEGPETGKGMRELKPPPPAAAAKTSGHRHTPTQQSIRFAPVERPSASAPADEDDDDGESAQQGRGKGSLGGLWKRWGVGKK